MFGEGLSKTMGIKQVVNLLVRSTPSETQTRKARFLRWKNVETIFHLKDTRPLEGKHVLLVDDVVTTGATLEACTLKILEVQGTKVSIAAIAYTLH
jgi:predicted amidophosphoribosyltransferase